LKAIHVAEISPFAEQSANLFVHLGISRSFAAGYATGSASAILFSLFIGEYNVRQSRERGRES
jgi:hypothetical protein